MKQVSVFTDGVYEVTQDKTRGELPGNQVFLTQSKHTTVVGNSQRFYTPGNKSLFSTSRCNFDKYLLSAYCVPSIVRPALSSGIVDGGGALYYTG